jgi:hypothetical protein
MMECTQIGVTQHEAFMRAVQKEFAKFERQEIEFRKKDREERAIELHIPVWTVPSPRDREKERRHNGVARNSDNRSMTEDEEYQIAREVHALLMSAHPQPTDPNMAEACKLASTERCTTARPRDDLRAATILAIQKARLAIVAGASADEGEKLLLAAVRAAEHWVTAVA